MLKTQSDQRLFLERIAESLPSNRSLVNELSDLLNISSDSAYRRMRCETELSFSEIAKLCGHFNLSFDSFLEHDISQVQFTFQEYAQSLDSFISYFQGLCDEVGQIRYSNAENKQLTFIGPGIPVLHFFQSEFLGAFKAFYWIKSMELNHPSYDIFNPEIMDERILSVGKTIYEHYSHVPSTEVWTDSSVLGAIHQIRFCWDTGLFLSKESAIKVCEELFDMVNLVKKQAQAGTKHLPNENGSTSVPFQLYYSELEDENTCVHVQLGTLQSVYLGHLNHRFIKTTNQSYCDTTRVWAEKLMKRSSLISQSAASTSYQFFKRGIEKLEMLASHIQST